MQKGCRKVESEVKETHDEPGGISDAAALAIDALIGGASITEAAQAAGVRRETLSRWIHGNPCFQAALNERRKEAKLERMAGLSALIADIEVAIRTSITNPDTPPAVILQSGLNILPKLYALLDGQKIGKTDAKAMIEDEVKVMPWDDNFNAGMVDVSEVKRLLKQSWDDLQSA